MTRFIIMALIIQSAFSYPGSADQASAVAPSVAPSVAQGAMEGRQGAMADKSPEASLVPTRSESSGRGELQNEPGRESFTGTNSGAEPVAGSKTGGREDDTNCTVITSRKLTFDQKKSTVVFEGNVVVIDPALKIESEHLTVLLSNDKKVELIKAEGSVVITRDTIQATSQMALYAVSDGKITLSGKPCVTRQRDNLTAETIVLWRNSNRIICEPHAHLIIYSDQKTQGQLKND